MASRIRRTKFIRADGYESVPSEEFESGAYGEKRASSALSRTAIGVAVLSLLVGVAGIILGGIAIGRGNLSVPDPLSVEHLSVGENITVQHLKVSGTLDLSMVDEIIPGPWLIPPVHLKKRNGKRVTHIVHDVQPKENKLLLGEPGVTYDLRFPQTIQDYAAREFYIYANSSLPHTVVFTGALSGGPCNAPYSSTTFDRERKFPLAVLGTEHPGSYLHFKVVDCGTVMVLEARDTKFCKEDMSECAHPQRNINADWAEIDNLNTTNIMTNMVMHNVYEVVESQTLNPAYSVQNVKVSATGDPIPQLSGASTGVVAPSSTITLTDTECTGFTGAPMQVRDIVVSDPYAHPDDPVGTRIIQMGTPESAFRGTGSPTDDTPPISTTDAAVNIAATEQGAMHLHLRYSIEPGYDYIVVRKNGAVIFFDSAIGSLSTANGFVATTVSTTVTPSDQITVQFLKDSIWSGGWDIVYFHYDFVPLSSTEITIPEDMTPYIGKEIQFCSGDDSPHTLKLEGANRFDANGYWHTILFQADGVQACCVKLSFTAADKVDVLSRDLCSVYCADDEHCVDPERPGETNPLHGWWRLESKMIDRTTYMQIDATKYPASTIFSAGDSLYSPINRQDLFPFDTIEWYYIGNNIWRTVPGVTNLYNSAEGGLTLVLQPEKDHFIVIGDDADFGYELATQLFLGLWKKVNVNNVPAIASGDLNTVSNTPISNPQYVLRRYVHTAIDNRFAFINKDENPDLWTGVTQAETSLEEIINTGVTHSGISIIRTQVTYDYHLEPVTLFRTDVYHHVSPVGYVTVSGFTGDCAVMNGVHEVSAAGTTNVAAPDILYIDYGNVPENRTIHHSVAIHFDSSAIPVFPGGNVANCTGTPELSVSYGPITPATNQIDMVAAWNYWFYENVKVGLHTNIAPYFDESTESNSFPSLYKVRKEWDDIAADVATNDQLKKRVTSRAIGGVSHFYTNPGLYGFRVGILYEHILNARYLDAISDSHGPHGIRPEQAAVNLLEFDSMERATFFYHIGIHNYLTDVAYPAWKMVGTSRTHLFNFILQALYPGGGGDEFDTIMVPYGEIPPAGYSYLDGSNDIVNGGFNGFTYEEIENIYNAWQFEHFFVGRVNTSYTGGVNIGYIRADDTSISDPFRLVANAAFCPTGICNISSPRNNREAYTSILAVAMQYLFIDLGCEHVIVDSRSNGGGFTIGSFALGDFFGNSEGHDIFNSLNVPRTGNDYGKTFDLSTYTLWPEKIFAIENSGKVFPALSETNYPGSTLTNGNLIVLTDERAGSGGDIFPNAFVGPYYNGTLGGDTEMFMIGSVEGTLQGYSCAFGLPVSGVSPRLPGPNGIGRPMLSDRIDCGGHARRGDGTNFATRHPSLEIDPSPSLSGLSGSNSLPADWETLVYPDLGFSLNSRARLSGDTRPQTPSLFVETNPLSTTIGSNVVTVTTSSPHGLATGDNVALGEVGDTIFFGFPGFDAVPDTAGIPSAALTGGHVITVTGANTFTFEATLGATYDCYPKIDCAAPAPATSTASGVGGTIRIFVRSHWRDAWLEQAVEKAIAGAKKRGAPRSPRVKGSYKDFKRARSTKTSTFDKREALHRYGRDVTCPGGVNLTHIHDMPTTKRLTLQHLDAEAGSPDYAADRRRVINLAAASIRKELQSGGMCLSESGQLMATPTCKEVARPVFQQPKRKGYTRLGRQFYGPGPEMFQNKKKRKWTPRKRMQH